MVSTHAAVRRDDASHLHVVAVVELVICQGHVVGRAPCAPSPAGLPVESAATPLFAVVDNPLHERQ